MIRRFLLYILLIISSSTLSQDIHFSHPNFFGSYYNPAEISFSEYEYNFALGNRQQWRSISTPFNTLYFATSKKIFNQKQTNELLTTGFYINYDKAGDTELGILQFNIPVSFPVFQNKMKTVCVSAGMTLGYARNNINKSKILTNQQITQPGSDNTVIDIEYFSIWNISAGLFGFYKIGKNKINISYSVSNINEPKLSFTTNKSILNRRTYFQCSDNIKISNNFDLSPFFVLSFQQHFREYYLGTLYSLYLTSKSIQKISIGSAYRFKDAMNVIMEIRYQKTDFFVIYDFNTSTLKEASNFRGGIELGLKYQMNTTKTKPQKILKCPMFI